MEVHEGVIRDGLPQLPRPLIGLRQRRGQNTLLKMAEDGNARTLRDNLEKLGFFVSGCDVSCEDPQTGSVIAGAGVIIVDTDHLEPATVSVLAASPRRSSPSSLTSLEAVCGVALESSLSSS